MDRFEAVRKRAQETIERAKTLYGVDFGTVKIGFNLKGKVAGWAGCKLCRMTMTRKYDVRFNREMIEGKYFQEIMDETVAHEVAHLVCYANPSLGRKHDAGWRRVCIALGGNGKERHSFDVTHANGGYDYLTTTGYKINISAARHALIQKQGKAYLIGRGRHGRIDRYSRWARGGQPIPANPPAGRVFAEMTYPAPTKTVVEPPKPITRKVVVNRGALLDKLKTTLG